jgi:hypothetical protein
MDGWVMPVDGERLEYHATVRIAQPRTIDEIAKSVPTRGRSADAIGAQCAGS